MAATRVNRLLQESLKPVYGLGPITPASSTPDYVSLKNAHRLYVVIMALNATTVTGSAITLKQATAVAGTGEKALSFTTMYANIDCAVSDLLVKTTVVSDTFTTSVVNSKQLMYVIDVRPEMLDHENGFDCVRVGTANAIATTLSVLYLLIPKSTVDGQGPSMIID